MKKFLFPILIFLVTVSGSFGAGFTDSVTVGLPGLNGINSFTLKLSQPSPAPAVYQATLLMASPLEKNAAFERMLAETGFLGFSTTSKVALVLVKSNADTNFARLTSPAVLKDSLLAGLARLAAKSNHPELAHAPLLPAGFARASRFALAVASSIPERTVAILSIRAYRLDAFAGGSVAGIPHMVLTGEVSGPDVRNNAGVYFSAQLRTQVLARRAAGEMVHQAVEMNASQSTFKEKTLNYLAAFAQNAMDKRIPPGSNPVAGPVNLIALSAANGYLGASQAYNNFKPSTYSVAPVGGALPLATSFWFTDLAIANTWKAFHRSAFDSVFVSPLPLPAVPYCSGQRPSSIDGRFYVQPGVVFDPNNFFRFEISDITGNFDHPIYSARWFGTTTSSLLSDSISNAIISDNLSYMRNVPSPVVKRYRIRVVSTKPYFESTNAGETDINFCGPAGGEPRVYLSTVRPYKSTYSPGDSIAVMVYKNPIFPYTPGNNLRIELSNKNYEFTAGLSTVVFSGVPPFTGSTTLDSFLVKIKLPDTLSFGNRYRLKPFIEGVSAVIGRQTSGNGHDITLVPNQTGNVIVINTRPVLNIGQTTAESGGNVLFDGGSAITARGVCWSTSPAPTVALSTKTNDGAGSGTYASNLTGLTSGTLYYVRAYATNGGGTQYGNELSFTTSQPNQVPVLTTDSIISITQTEAISGGNVTFDGNSEVTTRGICWSTNPNPTSDLATKTEDGTGPGTYISNITGLNPSTLYYVRAYAINTTGVGYGNQRSFTTSGQAVQLPSVLSNNVSNISSDSARGGGNVTFDGGGSVTARGICWSTSPLPTVDLPTKTVDGSGNGIFISWMTNLSPATSYFARAYATNAAGTSYGDEVTFTTIVSIRDAIGSADFRYYPNPADQVLFLDSGFPISPENIEVFDAQGRNVQVSVSKNFNQGLRIQTTQLPSGMYKILVRTAKGPIRFSFLR